MPRRERVRDTEVPRAATEKSFAPIDHLRSIDKRRVRTAFGERAAAEIAAIVEGLVVRLSRHPQDVYPRAAAFLNISLYPGAGIAPGRVPTKGER